MEFPIFQGKIQVENRVGTKKNIRIEGISSLKLFQGGSFGLKIVIKIHEKNGVWNVLKQPNWMCVLQQFK